MPDDEKLKKQEKEVKDFEEGSDEKKREWLKKILDAEEEGCDVGK